MTSIDQKDTIVAEGESSVPVILPKEDKACLIPRNLIGLGAQTKGVKPLGLMRVDRHVLSKAACWFTSLFPHRHTLSMEWLSLYVTNSVYTNSFSFGLSQ